MDSQSWPRADTCEFGLTKPDSTSQPHLGGACVLSGQSRGFRSVSKTAARLMP